MALTRTKKEEIVEKTSAKLKDSDGVIFTNFSGIAVEPLRELRTSLRESGALYQVTKRTLTRISMKNAGVDADGKLNKSSLGLVFLPSDLPGTAKILYNFSKENEGFEILNAYSFSEERWLEPEEVLELAKLPSREELLAKLVFMVQAPVKKLAMVLDQIAKQGGAPAAEAESETSSEADASEEEKGDDAASEEGAGDSADDSEEKKEEAPEAESSEGDSAEEADAPAEDASSEEGGETESGEDAEKED